MAKTIAQIETELLAAKAAEPLLDDLNSPSNTAIWRLWLHLVAVCHYIIYRQWDITKSELSVITNQSIIGTREWYVRTARGFSYNGFLIVSRASCRENGTKVILKVAKTGGTGIENLTPSELAALRAAITLRKIAGTDIDILSQTADLVALTVSVRYTGSLPTVLAAVKTAIKNCLALLPFDTSLSKGLLVDMLIQTVEGVSDAYIDEMKVNIGIGYTVINSNSVAADAGYFEIGKDNGNDLITINAYQ
ncbi:MAG: hypothetical protein RI894_1857 [Bacteroidota bacterium]|jgi:hypothetical protein